MFYSRVSWVLWQWLWGITWRSAEGFDENKNVADAEWLLELTQRLAHKYNLIKPWSLRKGEITPIDFSEFEIPLHKKMGLQISNEIGHSTLVECGLTVTQGISTTSEQEHQTPFDPVFGSASTSSTPTFDTLAQDQFVFKRRLPHSHPTRLKILSHQRQALHSKKICFRTGGRTCVQTSWGN